MANDARPVRLGTDWTGSEPTLAQLMDPVALEARLKEARLRRASALAQRGATNRMPPPFPSFRKPAAEPAFPASATAPTVVPPVPAFEFDPPAAEAPAPLAPDPGPELEAAETTPAAVIPEAVAATLKPSPAWLQPASAAQEPAMAPPQDAAPRRPALLVAGVPLWLTFVAGLGLGAAAVTVVLVQRPDAPAPAETATAPAETAAVPLAPAMPDPVAALSSDPPPIAAEPDVPAEATDVAAPPPPSALLPDAPLTAQRPALPAPSVDDAPAAPPMLPVRLAFPEPVVEPLTLDAAAPPATEAETAPAAAETAPPPATSEPPLPVRVSVHYPRSSEAVATATAEALRTAGVPDVLILPVNFSIARSNVRFYHAVDQQAAEAVAGMLAPDPTGEAPLARDFTDYRTPAAVGRVEVWLSGTSDGAGSRGSAPRTPAAAAPAQPAAAAPAPVRPVASTPPRTLSPAPAVAGTAQDQAEAVARILVERAYERLLQQAPNP